VSYSLANSRFLAAAVVVTQTTQTLVQTQTTQTPVQTQTLVQTVVQTVELAAMTAVAETVARMAETVDMAWMVLDCSYPGHILYR
jgi:hypothetical protein